MAFKHASASRWLVGQRRPIVEGYDTQQKTELGVRVRKHDMKI